MYINNYDDWEEAKIAGIEFDRWMAEHDAQIRAERQPIVYFEDDHEECAHELVAVKAATRTAALEEALTIARVAARLNSSLLGHPHPVAVSIAAAIQATAAIQTTIVTETL